MNEKRGFSFIYLAAQFYYIFSNFSRYHDTRISFANPSKYDPCHSTSRLRTTRRFPFRHHYRHRHRHRSRSLLQHRHHHPHHLHRPIEILVPVSCTLNRKIFSYQLSLRLQIVEKKRILSKYIISETFLCKIENSFSGPS